MAVISTSTHTVSNVVKQEYLPDLAYCRDVAVYNGAAKTFVVGELVAADGAVPATAADIVGVVMFETVAPATTDTNLVVLARGPATVSKSGLVLGLLAVADVVAKLETLGIQVLETV